MPGTHIFVTGQPGVGKSTLIQRVLQQMQLPPSTATGFFTEEVRSSGGERQGFDVVTLSGQRSPLSRAGTAGKGAPTVGKYVVDVPSFESLALPSIQPTPGTTRLVVIDEVGKMELFSAAFYPAVLAVLDTPGLLVFGSVPVARYGRTIPQVESLKTRPDVKVLMVTKDNRDRLVADLCQHIQAALQQLPEG